MDQLDLEYFETALLELDRSGFPEFARRLRSFVTATVTATAGADAEILPVTAEHRRAAWDAFYTKEGFPVVPPRPGDLYDTILLESLGRAIDNDRRIVAATRAVVADPLALQSQDPALAAGTSTHSTPQGDRSV